MEEEYSFHSDQSIDTSPDNSHYNEFPSNSIDSFSENEFNMMQDEILKKGKKLEPLIMEYAKNHKSSAVFLPIQNLFDLFKRELKMNLILRQNLLNERSEKQKANEKIQQFETHKKSFLKTLSEHSLHNFTDYNDIAEFFETLTQSIKEMNKFDKKKKKIFDAINNIKEENEQLKKQNSKIKNELEDINTKKSVELTQLLARIEQADQKSTSLTENIKFLQEQNEHIEKLSKEKEASLNKLKIDSSEQKEKIKELKGIISQMNASHPIELNELQEKLANEIKLNEKLNLLNKQYKEQIDGHIELQQKNANEISQLKIKVKKMELLENEEDQIKTKNRELKEALRLKAESLSKCEAVIEESKEAFILLRKKAKHFRILNKELSSRLDQEKVNKKESDELITNLKSKINHLELSNKKLIEDTQLQSSHQAQVTNEKIASLEDKFHNIHKNYSFYASENKRLLFQLKQASMDISRYEKENAFLLTKIESFERDGQNPNETNEIREMSNIADNLIDYSNISYE